MTSKKRIVAIIGGGNMAEAMIKGFLDQKPEFIDTILVSEPRPERRTELESRYKATFLASNVDACESADIIILAIKPQLARKVLGEIRSHVKDGCLIMSILAGTSISKIAIGLGKDQIIRIMPNTPAQFGKGMSVWTATPEVSESQRAEAQQLLACLGREICVDSEDYLDMATALSGTGPAYVFLFIEAMVDAGVHLGFSRHVAEELVLQTLEGSLQMVQDIKHHPATLRGMVTSPGGTSAAAIYELEKGSFRTIISKAIYAAFKRSQELGKN